MIIAIDFDGTCVTHSFPEVGKDIGAAKVLKRLVESGHQLILWTMRCDHPEEFELIGQSDIHAEKGSYLADALTWFEVNEIPLYGIQRNPTQDNWTQSPKCYAHLYIDDAALGCPLISDHEISDRPFVDWIKVEEELYKLGLL